MIKKGMRRQIVLHYILVVFLALLLVEVIFLIVIRTYYYDSIYTRISTHISQAEYFYQITSEDSPLSLQELLDSFALDYTELQVLTLNGDMITSSTGFQPDRTITTSDVPEAVGGGIGRWVGRQPGTNESVMAVSKVLQIHGRDAYVLRYVTSVEGVNADLLNVTLISVSVGIAVLAVVAAFSFGLANSIIKPLNNITAVSAQMARGKFNMRIKGDYLYEIGELASTLNYLAEEIVRSNQIKDDFISSISHELRTPLTSIKGWSETLISGGYDPEETKLGMSIISKESDRLIGLVEEILDFSKLHQNEMKLSIGTVGVRELLQEIILNLWAKAEKKSIRLVLEAEEGIYVRGDANRLKQVFLNLTDNAVKFSHEGSSIMLTARRADEEEAEIVVQDSGIGISQDHLNRVKDRFFQVDSLNGGTGLGLAISQQLVELHGGTMEIDSELGKGTRVTVYLQLAEPFPAVETMEQVSLPLPEENHDREEGKH
ncbi:Signal transduction histidine kinase [Paenibacillus sophorae]|uniref:histidine kinase n=1 Tax=Paenibacillus sophorae TaxID=1333845 RepID=A0A1H8FWF3_9BACL|nr:HAMP domain-containing sensor histidine kinase [Paenibacillus sophorae]QWU18433.1 HAMP domain-containing histidine kinase [Paenibacillus sophorae]SEN36012.1 Signal transduction histidine kinase [Paenibacillus sophorae]